MENELNVLDEVEKYLERFEKDGYSEDDSEKVCFIIDQLHLIKKKNRPHYAEKILEFFKNFYNIKKEESKPNSKKNNIDFEKEYKDNSINLKMLKREFCNEADLRERKKKKRNKALLGAMLTVWTLK